MIQRTYLTFVIIATVIGLSATVGNAANEECWQDGYKKGVCDAKGQTHCIPPVPPIPPIPAIGRGDCPSRFADGYRAGLASGR